MRVAFLGLGRMGAAMAGHLLDAGHDLTVWNRTPGRADQLTSRGAAEASSVPAAVRAAEAVVLMLAGPDSVRAVLGEVAGAAPAGALVVDCTTIGPAAAREAGEQAVGHGLRYVDAPVVGSVAPAAEGTLGVLVGGSADDVAAARPLLDLWGDPARVRHCGPVGSGNAYKIVFNAGLGVAMLGVGEALRLGRDLGLDRSSVLDVLAGGPFGYLVGRRRAMFETDEYQPVQFSLELLGKDLGLALESARVELPATAAAARVTEEAITAGHGADDYGALAGYVADEGHANSY
jgi:3-hydroxyisobutyrate dehydrogenase